MSEFSFQIALAKILTNDRLRTAFYEGDESWLDAHPLTDDELKRLRALRANDRVATELHADLLSIKRKRKIRTLLRGVSEMIGASAWDESWQSYLAQETTEAAIEPHTEALRFGSILRRRFETTELRCLIDYRLSRIRATLALRNLEKRNDEGRGQNIREPSTQEILDHSLLARQPYYILEFPCDVLALTAPHARKPLTLDRPTRVLLYAKFSESKVRAARIGRQAAALLDRCDGRNNGRALLETYTDYDGERQALRALTLLVRAGVIAVQRVPTRESEK